MPIEWRPEERQFHLHNGHISYVMRVLANGWLGHLHAGAPLAPGRPYTHLGPADFRGFSQRVGEPVGLELPTAGSGDFRIPSLVVEQPDGSSLLDLRYVDHRVWPGKPPLAGLPSTYVERDEEAETLEVELRDEVAGLQVQLRYTIFGGRPVIARSAVLANRGEGRLVVRTAMSASLDLPDSRWELVQLSGTWSRERYPHAAPLLPGRRSVGSLRGASGLEHNPFLMVQRPRTSEAAGEALGLSLVYSGNFLAEAEVEPRGTARLRIGIHPEGFAWTLEPGADLALPEAVLTWSGEGVGALSDAYHDLYRQRLIRGPWRDRPRPVVLNSWEGVYFDFDHDRLVDMARSTADLGIELFVLDDGWFGERDSDTSSLGDWVVDRRKLPGGLGALAHDVEALGIRFGLWIEPEMVSPRSRLFDAHPEWAIQVPGRDRTEIRHQLVLDLGRPEVVDHLDAAISGVLESAAISYVKWDMNRNITEPFGGTLPPERQGEFFHRYMLGVYELWRRLTSRFPEILFESCASGGGRFDPGLLAYAPQTWTSDDTDAVERLRIQWGTSLVYPVGSMGAHVSAVPNHQVGRITPLATRAAVAFFGQFGYELDPRRLTEPERVQVRAQVRFYAEHRTLFQQGRFMRLRSPFEDDGNEAAWMTVSHDRRRAVAAHYRVLGRPVPRSDWLRLRGLDPLTTYRVTPWPDAAGLGGVTRGGDELMRVGLGIEPADPPNGVAAGDFTARLFDLVATGE
jgi:alpha-galactosidase